MQVHQDQPALRKVDYDVDNKYSVKQHQSLGMFLDNGQNFVKYQPPRYHDQKYLELQEASRDTFWPVLPNAQIIPTPPATA